MDRLPIEIIIKILNYLDSYELIQFCKSFEDYNYLLQDKDIVRVVDFSAKFEITKIKLYPYITTNLNYNHIKVLSINYVYWIPIRHLRKLIEKLQKLEVLYAMNTKLGISSKDIAGYTKLKKLAVSIENVHFDYSTVLASKNLKSLKSLCLKITKKMEPYNGLYHETIYDFFLELKQLEELWISEEVEGAHHINYGEIAVSLNNLKKFVIKSKSNLPDCDLSVVDLVKVFECKRSGTELVFEKNLTKLKEEIPTVGESAESDYRKSCQICSFYCSDTPYGPRESQMLYFKKPVEEIYFYDLNFCETTVLCHPPFIEAALNILSSKNCSKLKRLSFRSCFFKNHSEKEELTSRFKRSRDGVKLSATINPFQTTTNNLKNLRELEILTCPNCTGATVISAYPLIQIFYYLEKLVLEVPHWLDGSFLKQVFINCRHLKSLYLFCKDQNDEFIKNLCENLKYSQNLRHFRLDYKELPITLLLNGFNKINQKKLLRIFVKCDTIQAADNQEQSFSRFLKNNPQLIFCFFLVSGNTNEQNIDLQRLINEYRRGYPYKFFSVKEEISFYTIAPIPTAHHDLIFYRSNVAAINIDEF